jgi:outer membrane protein OmpA-like peptidoglycan-associated protein
MMAGMAGAGLALAIGLGWISQQHTRDLERQLADSRQQAEALGQKVQKYTAELDRALRLASDARESAESAARKALEATAARMSAEDRTRAAEEAKSVAEDEALHSRQELAAVKERREQELNRMHQALARIAATRRTGSGLVVDLTNDSFHFDFDKSTLKPENREILSRIAGVLLAANGYRLFIDGHTDDVGSTEYNQQLSERRAESVGSYLVSAGVDPDVIEARGFGKSSPRAGGQTPDARRENRRVEIVLVDSVIQYQGVIASGSAR